MENKEIEMMMMIGEGIRRNTTVDVPPWSPFDDQKAGIGPPIPVSGVGSGITGEYLFSEAAVTALQRYLPSNEADDEEAAELLNFPVDIYSCDEFRMYEFKVRRCARGRSHDWTECPYTHPGEKARRRDPRKYNYSGVACPDFRKGSCKRGDACELAHGVFECWLHPARYRTEPCKDGTTCRRRVCFFAHTPEQLRVLSQQQQQSPRALDSYDGSPLRHHAQLDAFLLKGLIASSPSSTLIWPPSPPTESPPLSPMNEVLATFPMGSPVNEVVASLKKMQLSKVKSMPSSWGGVQVGGGLASPGVGVGFRPGFCSLPSTPKSAPGSRGWLDSDGFTENEPVPVEIVESGRALRALMYERLSKDNWLDRSDAGPASSASPDLGWVSELVK